MRRRPFGEAATCFAVCMLNISSPLCAADQPSGQVVKFMIERVSGPGITKSADVQLETAEGTSLDWAATVSEVARQIVFKGAASSVKVTIESSGSMPDSHRQLAAVYYGPDKVTSPWPDDPFYVLAIGHMLTSREVEYSDAYQQSLESLQKRGMDPDKADHIASATIARKYKLPRDWKLPDTGGGVSFHAVDALHTNIGDKQVDLDTVVNCVADADFVGPLTKCNGHSDSDPLAKEASDKAKDIIANADAHTTARIIDNDVYVRFNLEPWQLTTSAMKRTLYSKTAALVPMLFSLSKEILNVHVLADAGYISIKGQSSTSRYGSIKFSRSNNDSINWQAIDVENIPKIADGYEAKN